MKGTFGCLFCQVILANLVQFDNDGCCASHFFVAVYAGGKSTIAMMEFTASPKLISFA